MSKPEEAANANDRKRGPSSGAKYDTDKTLNDWYGVCQAYNSLSTKVSVKAWLQSTESGPKFSGTTSEVVSFGKHNKKFKAGQLQPSDCRKYVASQFPEVEAKLVAYMEIRARCYKYDKCGLSHQLLKAKATKYAHDLGLTNFKASNGWLEKTLRRNGKVGIQRHGEADDLSPEFLQKTIEDWKKNQFFPLIEEYDVPSQRIYNADQTGLFYQKLPNKIYVDKDNKKSYAGAKQMKDKTRVTLMVCTAANGSKVPLAVVGAAKKPLCFNLLENGKPPLAYTSQEKAWFNKRVTLWWVNDVFIPYHAYKFGNAHAILLLDNCSAHSDIANGSLPFWLHILFLPPNMTSNFQPADMGMISSLKIGYKLTMLSKLLDIFDQEGGYEGAAKIRKTVRRGFRGIEYGGKATVLDAMKILNDIWKKNGRYATEDGIRRCWRKSSILPLSMNTDIDAELGSNSMSLSSKTLCKEDTDHLCSLMMSLKVKANSASIDCNSTAIALQGSFVADHENYTLANYNNMIDTWICIEDDPDVIDAICEDELEKMETAKLEAIDAAADDEEPEPIEVEVDQSDILSYVEAVEALRKLSLSVSKLGVNEAAIVHLDRFASALHTANAKKPRRDGTLHAYFSSK
jgi:DDE superfamily endonuclease/Tc5 transposase DNA-binding domain